MATITLDKERHLKLTLRGMLAYEELTGKSLLSGFNPKTMTTRESMALAWCCLVDEDRSLTYEAFIDMVEVADIPKLSEAVSQCIVESFPAKEESTDRPLARSRRNG